MRVMYDGIGSNAMWIRTHVWQPGNLIGYYIAGNSYIWTTAEKNLFPASALVSITLTASASADVLDVESGGATPDETHDWILRQHQLGYYRPTIYCNLATVPQVRLGAREFILGKDYDIWVADWDGTTTLPYPSAVAKQDNSFATYDESVVYDDNWPHRKPTSPLSTKNVPVPSGHILVGVPKDADHIVMEPFAIVHSKPVPLPHWGFPA